MNKISQLFVFLVTILVLSSCEKKSLIENSQEYIYNSNKVKVGYIKNEEIIIPNIQKLIGSEVNFQGKTGIIKNVEIQGKISQFKYLISEIEFKEKSQSGLKSVKVASLLFEGSDLESENFEYLIASGEEHTCSGDSDDPFQYCSCCSFKYDSQDSSKIIGCQCCQFGRCAHTVKTSTGGNEDPTIGGRKTFTLMDEISSKITI